MNKVNLILLIIAMFTGFPAVVAVSQNVTVTTPSQTYYLQSSPRSNPATALSLSSLSSPSSSVVNQSAVVSSSVISSISSSLPSSSVPSSLIISSAIPKPVAPKVVVAPIIVVKPISSAVKVMSDVKKPEPVKETAKLEIKEVVKQEIKTESSESSKVEKVKTEPRIIIPVPIVVSSSSQVPQLFSEIAKPKANSTFAQQITARCEILGCNATQLIRVMKCESSGNPTVVGAGLYIGLFQFLPSTFNAYKVKAGLPNGDIYNGSDQIHVATYMFANGQARQWGCK